MTSKPWSVLALLFLVVAVIAPPEAAADKCKEQQKRFAKSLAALNDLASKATTSAVACAFADGPDDREVARMAGQAVKAYRTVVSLKAATTSDCTRRNLELPLDAVSHWVGDRLGYMYATCSSKAEALVQQGLSEEERVAKIKPLVQEYIADILRRSGIEM